MEYCSKCKSTGHLPGGNIPRPGGFRPCPDCRNFEYLYSVLGMGRRDLEPAIEAIRKRIEKSGRRLVTSSDRRAAARQLVPSAS
jgi:hypothetical protein